MCKMGSHCSFGIWNTSYGQKKGRESNYQFDSRPEKVENRPDLLIYRWHATYRWKSLDEGYNFSWDRISIRGLLTKLWGSKVARVPTWAISRFPLGSPGTKSHLDLGPVERCRVYYKGEGGGLPQVQVVVSVMCPCCPWLILAPKVFQLCTNHLVWVLCRLVWVSEACQFFLVPSRNSSTPLYPSKCCELRSVPQLLIFPLFSIWDSHLNLSSSWLCIINEPWKKNHWHPFKCILNFSLKNSLLRIRGMGKVFLWPNVEMKLGWNGTPPPM